MSFDFDTLEALRRQHPAWRLLQADSAALVASFLHRVFVMPNRQEGADIEGFGMTFLEAAASEKPAIGGTTGGAPEAVDHGRTGVLVSGTDAAELADAIVRLVRDPGEGAKLGRAGRARVLERFTWDHATAAVTAIHRDAAGIG